MKRKILVLGLVLTLLISVDFVYADKGSIQFDESKSIVRVKLNADDYVPYKVQVKKGNVKYNYNLYDSDEVFPLQMGDGVYTVKIYEKISGNKYRAVNSQSKSVKLEPNKVYLQSIQNINWSDTSKAISLAKQLGLSKDTPKDEFQAIYDEIVKNIVYDKQKAAAVSSRYLPSIDNTYLQKKGICYDYSSLMASMLRSLGIPTKMIHGYSVKDPGTYHAWNEVLLNGEWIVVDTTFDAQIFGAGGDPNPQKPVGEYNKNKEF